MKNLPLLLLLLLNSMLLAADPPRQRLNINREWKFEIGDYPGAEVPEFDDAKWGAIGLPHSFSTPYFQSKDYYSGYGWYRKHFEVPANWEGKRVFVEFDGAFQVSEVFVNGRRIGEHKGGYTGFSMELTRALKPGANVLAVRLNSSWNARLTPRGGDHIFPGGIYRDAWFVVTNPVHVTWYGTFVTTPVVSKDSATVNVKTEVQNQSGAPQQIVLTTELRDPNGRTAARIATSQTIAAGATVTLEQTSKPISQPLLWSPEHPVLYAALTTISDGGKILDQYLTPFGVRGIKWTADKGFFLNGEHRYFHGANVHEDHAGWANAVTNAGAFRDVKLVKEAGLDFIRGSHYPHQPAFAEACDRLGVMFWSENCFWGPGGAHKEGTWTADAYPINPADDAEFDESVANSLRDEIRIFRNHPSIIVWSMCNEVFFSDRLDKVSNLLSRMVKLTHELDPSRPAAIGGCQRGKLDKLGDVAGYNGDGARLFPDPGIPNVVTEYGSVTSLRPGPYTGQFKPKDGLNEKTPEYPWRSGDVLWCAFDYGTIFGPNAGSMGFVDYARIPKRSWYWYRDHHLHIPPPQWPAQGKPARLALTADKMTIQGTNAQDDVHLLVTVTDASGKPLSNSPPVVFTIVSGPGEFPTGRTITFDEGSDNPIRDGQAAIEFRSYSGGKSVIRATSPGLQDGLLTITTVGEPQFVEGTTPLVEDRPYVPFSSKNADQESGDANVAANRPTVASSEAPGHNGSNVLDGNSATFWSAADDRPGAWWTADLEQLHTLKSVQTTFPAAGDCRYRIEGSVDGTSWTLLVDNTNTKSNDQVRKDNISGDPHFQFVRITLTALPPGQPAAISDVKVIGRRWP
jgi:hypothetical protein